MPLRRVLVGISLFGACANDPPPPEAKAEPAPATLAPPAAAAPPVDEVHEVTLASTPSGAKVLLSGAEIGTTPYPLRFKRTTTVQLTADGYLPAEVTVDATSDPNVITQLQPDPAAAGATGGEVAAAGGVKTASADPPSADPKSSTSPKAKPADPMTPSPATPTPTPTPTPRPSSSLPYPDVAAAKSDYQAGRIDRDAYDQAVRKLKLRRTEKINAIKAKYQAGEFDKDEYNRRKRIIDNEYRGT